MAYSPYCMSANPYKDQFYIPIHFFMGHYEFNSPEDALTRYSY